MHASPLLAAQLQLFPEAVVVPTKDHSWQEIAQFAPGQARLDQEYSALTSSSAAALLDHSWKSLFRVVGADRASFLQGMLSNDVAGLAPGAGCHAALLDTKGHILAAATVHCLPESLLLETDPRCGGQLSDTLENFLIMEDAEIVEETDQFVSLTVAGGGAAAIVERTFGINGLAALQPLQHLSLGGQYLGGFVVATPFGHHPAFEVWIPTRLGEAAWRTLANAATPVGLQAEETLRIQCGLPEWGAELSGSVLLPELALPNWVSYTKGCYVGQEIIARLNARGHVNRELRKLIWTNPNARPALTDALTLAGDQDASLVRLTSITHLLPGNGRAVALGYVRREALEQTQPLQWQGADGSLRSDVQVVEIGAPIEMAIAVK